MPAAWRPARGGDAALRDWPERYGSIVARFVAEGS